MFRNGMEGTISNLAYQDIVKGVDSQALKNGLERSHNCLRMNQLLCIAEVLKQYEGVKEKEEAWVGGNALLRSIQLL